MRLNQIAASGVFAFLAMSVVAPASVLAQSASEKCNTVVDSTGKPVVAANNTAVLHAGSYDCPPPPAAAAAAPAAAVPPAAPLANAVYFVFFDFDRSAITPAAQDILNTVVSDARRTNASRLNVLGHTDTSGSPAYNQRLSERRASAVREALVQRGVPAGQITTRGLGETQPLIATGDGVREPSNRRAEIRFQ
ncbi:OmpA family protein [Skermanella mucosa]|uniref:OmpA family protein n=1 Tax=Skermanella mucosa TaxID=1789672 RepID=UPI00192B965B|nr:OmpA family protein [Skermanella mucosa]UEM20168.1 OmpA family protein [Skermanella mucosa]